MSSKRAYISPLREQAAAQTRALILLRAAELFADRGYGRVTVADIASAAGVASKTVFASVGSKGDILDRIVGQGVVASGYEQAMRQILALRTPEAVLEALARGTRAGNEGQFTVHEAIRKALPVHEHGEVLWERATAAYRDALRTAARHLHTLTPPPSYSVEETADLLWFWFGPTGWRTLVVENGWSWDRAEDFLRRTAVTTLC
ncbi:MULTISPECIES: TetR/AcrR family transcriptional regulator [unclassified Streptomyces]|uniref:TetR/AcrR family transcriptional regulator n=1 Tax=unclassified Streptomyces TaxID=2593676 RepID=UPI002DD90091|nr:MULTISPECIES: helix-turn-helix domain-containing protein [unclassified Streptomyces]WSF89336.1 TetR/AcrR family transcriptional regulator [Streptomyces sp. NBC_01744]WSC34498.1 TetR/AcrR family transcriptional regulator [Streptomyces sp. NBC_01763]WSC58231.1 TetR/AcrR family transcriptional regulator [Streptomyces sp. NBC_01761]WSD22446.1 TetR/AcrR family transcriptional regulator [Streptomyces sp. NBC_01751]WSJ55535.1 TetR/AcrR family transcriptional regulator [Streptomyces sp. NBC_01318]